MSRSRRELYCPVCDVPVPEADVDWPQLRAFCARCGQELVLYGYVEPGKPDAGARERAFRPLSMERPRGLDLERSAAPGVESLRLGSRMMHGEIRLERDSLVFKGFLGREHRFRLEQVLGFAALQRVIYPEGEGLGVGEIRWHVVAVVTDGTVLRVWEYADRDHARYVASELNKALLFMRSPSTPYRG